MAITIVATAGSASANAIITEAEAIAYVASRLNASTWTTVTGATCTETEKAAIIEATRELDVLGYIGQRVNATQALSWPRDFALDPDDPNGDYFDSDEIPTRLKNACCELSFQFLKAGTTDVAALDASDGITEKTIDVITTRYAEPHARKQGLARYPRIMNYIRPLLVGSSGAVVSTVRG